MKKIYSHEEVTEIIQMTEQEHFDIRAVTLGVNLLPASNKNKKDLLRNIHQLLTTKAKDLVTKVTLAEKTYGIPIINKRITVTPISLVLQSVLTGNKSDDIQIAFEVAQQLDRTAVALGVDFIGGYGGFVEKGISYADEVILESLPRVLSETQRLCTFINVATTKAGINMKAVAKLGDIIHTTSDMKDGALACAKFVVFCNSVTDNPFMAGGFHGIDHADEVLHIGVSGPGVVKRVIETLPKDAPLENVATAIKNISFKMTRAAEVIGKDIAQSLSVKFGSIDMSLAPTTAEGDSVGLILEKMGLDRVGTHGTIAALALLTDSMKKGGVMASSSVGGLSGAFIPVSEDIYLSRAVKDGVLSIDMLQAMTSVCSVGLDMVAVPGDIKSTSIAGIIADEMAIGMVNHKTTAVRIIPVKGKKAGEKVYFGGLLGEAYIIPVHDASVERFIWRKGYIPPTVTSFRN